MLNQRFARTRGALRRLQALLAATALLTVGCPAKDKPPAVPAGVEPAMAPILPASVAPLYALGEATPRDPLVRAAVEAAALPWVESLSGAAGRLAMGDEGQPDLVGARWAAARAGYPYDVQHIIVGEENAGAFPAGLAELVRQRLAAGDHVGLARARVLERDRWVALVGRPALTLPDFAREQPQGAAFRLTADRPAEWALVSPVGALKQGELPIEVVLDLDGEWWLQIRVEGGELGLPIYVDIPTPAAGLLSGGSPGLKGPADAEAALLGLLGEVRSAFGAPVLTVDPTLRSLTAHPLEALQAGTFDATAAEARLRSAGFVDLPPRVLSCEASDAAACLDSLLRAPAARAALLDPSAGVVGLSVVVSTRGLQVVLAIAGA